MFVPTDNTPNNDPPFFYSLLIFSKKVLEKSFPSPTFGGLNSALGEYGRKPRQIC